MIRKIIGISSLVILVLFFAGCLGLSHMRDNPENSISLALVENAAEKYRKSHFPDMDYQLSPVQYIEKDDKYFVSFTSEKSPDSNFYVTFDHMGAQISSSYELLVQRKVNTAQRISQEYGTAVQNALGMPPGTTAFVCSGSLIWKTADVSAQLHCIISDELELNGTYTPADFGAQAGRIWFRIDEDSSDQTNAARLAEILLYIRQTLDQANIPFYTLSCSVKCANGNYLELNSFPYADIVAEDLQARITQALD